MANKGEKGDANAKAISRNKYDADVTLIRSRTSHSTLAAGQFTYRLAGIVGKFGLHYYDLDFSRAGGTYITCDTRVFVSASERPTGPCAHSGDGRFIVCNVVPGNNIIQTMIDLGNTGGSNLPMQIDYLVMN